MVYPTALTHHNAVFCAFPTMSLAVVVGYVTRRRLSAIYHSHLLPIWITQLRCLMYPRHASTWLTNSGNACLISVVICVKVSLSLVLEQLGYSKSLF